MLDIVDDNGEKISLPDGYEPCSEWLKKHPEVSDMDEISDRIRWLNNTIAFVLDETEEGYLNHMEKCRRDSNALKKELERELKKRELPVTVKKAHDKRKMAFIIRGPFLSSEEKEKQNNRMQGGDTERDNFVLHFDAKQKFQLARFWKPKDLKNPADFMKIYGFRVVVESEIAKIKQFLDDNYGNWNVIASRIADIIEEALPMLES